jgi:hydroxypyruvate isomerase
MSHSRRRLLKGMALSSAAFLANQSTAIASTAEKKSAIDNTGLKGNVHHSVSRWTYGDLDIETLCLLVKSLGFSAIDLVGPEDWPTLKKHNIDSSMCNGAELNLVDGWIHPEFHDELTKRYLAHIDLMAEAGYKNLVCFSGNARGMEPKQGLENAVKGLQRILPAAEKKGVIIQLELFNSKINHPDCMADNSPWGIELCQRLDSPNFKLLYDIYHMQISEGDIIRTIRDNHQYFGHYHTAGVPGRNEIDDTQELFYPAIVKAILETGYQGYLAQEFVPTPKTPEGRAESLRQAIRICDV